MRLKTVHLVFFVTLIQAEVPCEMIMALPMAWMIWLRNYQKGYQVILESL